MNEWMFLNEKEYLCIVNYFSFLKIWDASELQGIDIINVGMTSLPQLPDMPATNQSDATPVGGFHQSAGVMTLLVLAIICAILGAIYGYIYFVKINPKSNRARKYVEQQSQDDDQGNAGTATHLFLFRKSWNST